jgi:carboxylesterase type B
MSSPKIIAFFETSCTLNDSTWGRINFAKTGDPNAPGLPDWLSYSAISDKVMMFGSASCMKVAPFQKRFEALNDYFESRRRQRKQ